MTTEGLRRVAILGAARTPTGKYGGALKGVPAVVLGGLAAGAALARSGVPAVDVTQVFMGHCIQAGTGQNPARQVLRAVGLPDTAGGITVNMVCGSGMQAIFSAANAIRTGDAELAIAGGMESMSSAPYLVPSAARWGLRYGPSVLDDAMLRDALLDAYGEHEQMGLTGERVARDLGLTRADVDEFAVRSHRRAADATTDGTFAPEIAEVPPGTTPSGSGLKVDEGPRGTSTLESLGRLRPSFDPKGLLTAGNSSQLSDGGSALVLASEDEVRRRGAAVLAWIHSGAVSGVAPDRVM
ncbi:MAG TPA: thiolase family protein, partial [Thermoplasmata archaeon]